MNKTRPQITLFIIGIIALIFTACSGSDTPGPQAQLEPTSAPVESNRADVGADVIEVSVSGSPGDYAMSVTVSSPDIGCRSYADWWEVVSEDGELLTRRVLLHSHVDEQPFTRSGGPLDIQPNETVIVRAHMSGGGYGGEIMRGTVQDGFALAETTPGFAANLETQSPLPTSCAF